MNCDTCNCPHEGDVVEHIMNTDVFGVVIGFQGSLVGVRTSPSLNTLWFHDFELRLVDREEYEPGDGEEEDLPDNIIDFTKARKLRETTRTKGAA